MQAAPGGGCRLMTTSCGVCCCLCSALLDLFSCLQTTQQRGLGVVEIKADQYRALLCIGNQDRMPFPGQLGFQDLRIAAR